jgi:hypothetical protein
VVRAHPKACRALELTVRPAGRLYMVVRSLDPTGRGRRKWITRWKPALNAFEVTFDGRLLPQANGESRGTVLPSESPKATHTSGTGRWYDSGQHCRCVLDGARSRRQVRRDPFGPQHGQLWWTWRTLGSPGMVQLLPASG